MEYNQKPHRGDLFVVSIIIPVFNERNTIEKVIDRVSSLCPKEIIIVDDGSTDGTRDVIKKAEGRSLPANGLVAEQKAEIKILCHEKNQGKGAAIRTALKYVTGEIVAIQDADLEYNPEEITNLVAPIIEGTSQVVYGSRFLKKPMKNIYKSCKFGNWFLSKFISTLCGQRITDSYTCYKVFKTDVARQLELESKRFEIEAEITVKLLKKGIKVLELPINYNPRRLSEGKKIGWLDGIKGLWTVFRYANTRE